MGQGKTGKVHYAKEDDAVWELFVLHTFMHSVAIFNISITMQLG